jgi:hypothetical protein
LREFEPWGDRQSFSGVKVLSPVRFDELAVN